MKNKYRYVAEEYYDRNLHPTCANLGFASKRLLEENVELIGFRGTVLEIGAGKSPLIELIEDFCNVDKAFITDSSKDMLKHSRIDDAHEKISLLVCDSNNLPFDRCQIDVVISLLGDPYNTKELWSEVSRVLKPNGRVFFTTPSWEWAEAFRGSEEVEKKDAAHFLTKHGNSIYMPSYIMTKANQERVMKSYGLHVKKVSNFTLRDLKREEDDISNKINAYLNDSDPIVTGYIATKTQSCC